MYELNLEKFSGPLNKLLELIEERQMEITELSLAEITADFLQYIKTRMNTDENPEGVRPRVGPYGAGTDLHGSSAGENNINTRIIADFVVIAAKLLLIKSKALLPEFRLTDEEKKDIKDLEERLRFYRAFKPAMNNLKKLWEQNNISVSRPLFSGRPAIFYPSENLKLEELLKAVRIIFESFIEIPEKQTIKTSLISLEQKIEEIMKRLNLDLVGSDTSSRGLEFKKLTAEKSRSEIVVLFLAVLYLLTNQLIRIEQKKGFEEIMIMNKEL